MEDSSLSEEEYHPSNNGKIDKQENSEKENINENIKPPSEKEQKKQEWSRQMRLKFTNPDMINQDGSLNQE